MIKILFTGGGTGGHILPILAIARELQKLNIDLKQNLQLFYLGPKDDFNELLLSEENIKVSTVMAGKIRRYATPKAIGENIVDILFKIPFGILEAFFKVLSIRPHIVLSKGAYGAIPVTFVCWVFGIPVFLHESDSIPGLANRVAAGFSRKIFTSFPHTEKFSAKKVVLVGNPIRKEILQGSKEEASRIFSLTNTKPVVLFLGGSQGSEKINDMVLAMLPLVLDDFEIIHQTGEKNFNEVQKEARAIIQQGYEPYYHVVPFLKETELRHAYKAADVIINRAGSGSIFEAAALGKPAIFIPLEGAAQNHQVYNAYTYAKTGACVILEEANLTPHFFAEKLRYLLSNSQELKKMSRAAFEFAKPEAAKIIAQYLIEYLKKK